LGVSEIFQEFQQFVSIFWNFGKFWNFEIRNLRVFRRFFLSEKSGVSFCIEIFSETTQPIWIPFWTESNIESMFRKMVLNWSPLVYNNLCNNKIHTNENLDDRNLNFHHEPPQSIWIFFSGQVFFWSLISNFGKH
jgi:hypothetical protein